jgi:hypothetical protein
MVLTKKDLLMESKRFNKQFFLLLSMVKASNFFMSARR